MDSINDQIGIQRYILDSVHVVITIENFCLCTDFFDELCIVPLSFRFLPSCPVLVWGDGLPGRWEGNTTSVEEFGGLSLYLLT